MTPGPLPALPRMRSLSPALLTQQSASRRASLSPPDLEHYARDERPPPYETRRFADALGQWPVAHDLPLYRSNSAITMYPPSYSDTRGTRHISAGVRVPARLHAHERPPLPLLLRQAGTGGLSFALGAASVLGGSNTLSGWLGYVGRGAIHQADALKDSRLDLLHAGALGGALLGLALTMVLRMPVEISYVLFGQEENSPTDLRVSNLIVLGAHDALCASFALNFFGVVVGAVSLAATRGPLSATTTTLWAGSAWGALLADAVVLVVYVLVRHGIQRRI